MVCSEIGAPDSRSLLEADLRKDQDKEELQCNGLNLGKDHFFAVTSSNFVYQDLTVKTHTVMFKAQNMISSVISNIFDAVLFSWNSNEIC